MIIHLKGSRAMDITRLNESLESASPQEILEWSWESFRGRIASSSSFQTESVALLHMISQVCPEMPVIFVDTGFHFPETLRFRDELWKRYCLNITVVHPAVEKAQLLKKYGHGLYSRDPDLCCYINKVKPMQMAVSELGLEAIISGIRRGQTAHRKGLCVLETQQTGLLRIHPVINWNKRDLFKYIEKNNLPFHPLYSKGYTSIGCEPCTRPTLPSEDDRAGRWAGMGKKECGLHLDWASMKQTEGQSD